MTQFCSTKKNEKKENDEQSIFNILTLFFDRKRRGERGREKRGEEDRGRERRESCEWEPLFVGKRYRFTKQIIISNRN